MLSIICSMDYGGVVGLKGINLLFEVLSLFLWFSAFNIVSFITDAFTNLPNQTKNKQNFLITD